jgi:hypothetical protein
MAPWKMMKKTDAASEASNPNANILPDTMAQAIESVKSWTHVFEVLEHEVINFLEDFAMKWTILSELNLDI